MATAMRSVTRQANRQDLPTTARVQSLRFLIQEMGPDIQHGLRNVLLQAAAVVVGRNSMAVPCLLTAVLPPLSSQQSTQTTATAANSTSKNQNTSTTIPWTVQDLGDGDINSNAYHVGKAARDLARRLETCVWTKVWLLQQQCALATTAGFPSHLVQLVLHEYMGDFLRADLQLARTIHHLAPILSALVDSGCY